MAAIDLLFDTKGDSERLHQIVLGPLMTRSNLLPMLVPRLAATRPISFDWEPSRGIFDLSVQFRTGNSIYFELKVDSGLSKAQVTKQFALLKSKSGEERLVYILLGASAVLTDRPMIRVVADENGVSRDRYDVCDSKQLIAALEDPKVHVGLGADHRDVRDLVASYREALKTLEERLHGFRSKPITEWEYLDRIGFFSYCREKIPAMRDAGIDYVANRRLLVEFHRPLRPIPDLSAVRRQSALLQGVRG
jgi:hypothetical protein